MRSAFLRIVTIFFAAFLLLAPGAVVAEEAAYRIGVIVPLTGSLAHVGADIRDGMQLAQEQLPANGPKFELMFEDSRHDLREAVTAAQRLITEKSAEMIISLWDCADPVAPLTEQKKLPHLAIRWDPGVAANHRFTFTLESTYRTYSHDQLKLLRFEGAKKIAILQAESKGWSLAGEELAKSAPQYGLSVSGQESFVPGERDFRPTLLKLVRSAPDYIVLESLPPDTENILRQLRELRPAQKHLGYYEILEKPEILGDQRFIAQYATVEKFDQAFQKRFGHPFRIRAPHAHALIELLAFAIEKSDAQGKLDGESIVRALMTIRDFPSAIGPLTVGPERSIENPNVIKRQRNGKLEIVGKAESDAIFGAGAGSL